MDKASLTILCTCRCETLDMFFKCHYKAVCLDFRQRRKSFPDPVYSCQPCNISFLGLDRIELLEKVRK